MVVYISRIGEALEARHLTISRLQERLAARGIRVSRGALTRLASDEPIEEIRLSVIGPVLDELRLTFESAFDQVDPTDVDARRRVRSQAKTLAGLTTSNAPEKDAGTPAPIDPREELRTVVARSLDQLKATYPDIVDRRGRVRRRALAKAIEKQLGGTRPLTSDEYSRVIAPGLTSSGSATLLRDSDG
jgi:hypothetical protein